MKTDSKVAIGEFLSDSVVSGKNLEVVHKNKWILSGRFERIQIKKGELFCALYWCTSPHLIAPKKDDIVINRCKRVGVLFNVMNI